MSRGKAVKLFVKSASRKRLDIVKFFACFVKFLLDMAQVVLCDFKDLAGEKLDI